MTNVILTVLIFALGIRPLELARLEFWSSMETCSPSVNGNTSVVKACRVEQNDTDRISGIVAVSRLTFYTLEVSLHITRFNNQKFYMMLALR